MAHLNRAVPVLPVADLEAALETYAALGFTTRRREDFGFDDERYGFAARDEVRLHLREASDGEPVHVTCYLFVDDADGIASEWRTAGIGTVEGPEDTDHGMREGAFTDPDGNVVRFGSPIPTTRQLRVVIGPES